MNPQLLDGKAASEQIRNDLRSRVEKLKLRGGPVPVLVTILVGNNPSSEVYVKMKGKACESIGLGSRKIQMPEETTTEELLKVIDECNADPTVRGILLQHPSPSQIDERAAFDRIAIDKDVDGVTAFGFGRMSLGIQAYPACTPAGIVKLLDHYKINLSGLHAVIVGRSPILGKPMAQLLLNRDCTITVCHSRTKDLPRHLQSADLVVAACGKPRYIVGDWIKEGAIVVDAGYNDGNIGDADFESCAKKASWITPVPGGVGPMTITTLIAHTVESAEKASG
ncbi:MAG TPA: tetrahydrofolate dehydrogenase/cyclohydrolase catalytic domain-containing protein [Leptospiraceae bacterium]|nr:bifunctional methylenetetrahydrofolate dehydrogenase/methenyltetrahydrofolate cyclohydrolase [Leptospirales bacterium]HMX55313.1 tetrahydrofolate dehydrogenase/cyclohydrolase catalytic domain-containing protein [Leptospiraceae bacterium]HMY46336.1 tetrahydrofolate dehydrogenase/cyclohydrolase catalytic domain-containing protein [Leptospiraceae bacterium]HNE23071.1 tetrahydrofolate dehydrogenase/cyclohydrolase catalytic domain-containing protein [Leptospiraceae bacterium]HNL68697.1 tetrahydro